VRRESPLRPRRRGKLYERTYSKSLKTTDQMNISESSAIGWVIATSSSESPGFGATPPGCRQEATTVSRAVAATPTQNPSAKTSIEMATETWMSTPSQILPVSSEKSPSVNPATIEPSASGIGLPKWIMQYGMTATKIE